MKLSHFGLTALVFWLLSGCQIIGPNNHGGGDDTPREIWAEQHDGDYSFVINRGCFCGLAGVHWIQVVDREIQLAIRVADQEPVDPSQLHFLETIEDLFDLIDEAEERGADRLEVTYADEGYPSELIIDFDFQVADDEFFAAVSEVIIGVSRVD